MAYFIQTVRGRAASDDGYLTEFPAQQLSKMHRDCPNLFFSRISATEAHAWVKAGNRHGTALYTETVPTANWPYSRQVIRRAKDGY